MAQGVVSVTAFTAFGSLHVTITQRIQDQGHGSYRTLVNETVPLQHQDEPDAVEMLSALGALCWTAAERLRDAPF